MWWASDDSRATVVDRCVDPASPRESAGVVAMALHGVGRARLVELSKSAAPEVDDIVPAVAGADVAGVVGAVSRLVGRDQAVRLVGELSYEAADGARQVARQLVSKGVPVPVAIERAAAAFGPGPGETRGFVEKMAGPVVPQVVSDAGLREVQVWASLWSDGFEPVAKDEFIRRGRKVIQPRDHDGEFASVDGGGKDEKTSQEEKGLTREDRLREARQRNQEKGKRSRQKRSQRDARREQRERQEHERQAAQASKKMSLREQLKQESGKKSLAGLAAQSRVSVADMKAQAEANERQARREKREKRAKRQERTAYRRERLNAAAASALEKLMAAPMSSDGGVDWDPPTMSFEAIDRAIYTHKFDKTVVDPRLYVQVPLDVVHRAYMGTNKMDARNGPRISVQAANGYLENDGRDPLVVRRMEMDPRRMKDLSAADKKAGIWVEEDGRQVLLKPMPLISLDASGEPVMNIHVPAAWTKGWTSTRSGATAELAPFQSIMAGLPFAALSSIHDFMNQEKMLDAWADRGSPDTWRGAIRTNDAVSSQADGVWDDVIKMANRLASEAIDYQYDQDHRSSIDDNEIDPAVAVLVNQERENEEAALLSKLLSGEAVDSEIPAELNDKYHSFANRYATLQLYRRHPHAVTKWAGVPDELLTHYYESSEYPLVDESFRRHAFDITDEDAVLVGDTRWIALDQSAAFGDEEDQFTVD